MSHELTPDEILTGFVHAVETQRQIIEEHDAARSSGFDAKIIKIVVAKRAMIREHGEEAVAEIDSLTKLYLATVAAVEAESAIKPANGMDCATRAGARAEPETAPSASEQRKPSPVAQPIPEAKGTVIAHPSSAARGASEKPDDELDIPKFLKREAVA